MTVVKIEKSKRHQKVCHKNKLKFKNYQNCLEATQFEKKIYYLDKNEINMDSLKKQIAFKDFINLYKNCTAKPYSFLVIDATPLA